MNNQDYGTPMTTDYGAPPPPTYGMATAQPPTVEGGTTYTGTVQTHVLPGSQNAEVIGINFGTTIFKLAIVASLFFSLTGLPAMFCAYLYQNSPRDATKQSMVLMASVVLSAASIVLGLWLMSYVPSLITCTLQLRIHPAIG